MPKTLSPMTLLALAVVMAPGAALAAEEPRQPWAPGIETPGYVWNEMRGEKLIALQAQGDPLRGKIAYEVCQGCHEPDARGETDGSYPRLAGQHASVLIKQLTDVRAGLRDNQKMYPYAAEHVITPQEIADIAVYLEGLPAPEEVGHGPGTHLDRGEGLYTEQCQECHGQRGQGDPGEFYPRVGGQHYAYLLREVRMIRDGRRRNAHPDMIEAVEDYSEEELAAVADYMSRLPGTARASAPGGAGGR
ncbi:MAG: c-type cytochrome [Alphaproteobacteria bacterium]|jgi:cytochrome c553|nr:c-type cytochrome [Alphaproteobacteria bacterium]